MMQAVTSITMMPTSMITWEFDEKRASSMSQLIAINIKSKLHIILIALAYRANAVRESVQT